MNIKKILFGALLLPVFSAAQAVPVIYSDEATFLGATGSLSMEGFEGSTATNDRTLSSLSLTDFDMTMSSGATLGVFDQVDFFGGHATEGVNYVGFSDGHAYVDIALNFGIDTFGINLTDFGDFGSGSVTFSNNAGDMFTAAVDGQANANEQFFGIVSDFSFTNVRLSQNIAGEFYAVDEVYYGNSVAAPAPSILALLGIGLAAFGFTARKRS